MARFIVKHPSRESIAKWGVLAHVDDNERQRILDVPHGLFKREIKTLEREVDHAKFPRKPKTNVKEYYANTNLKLNPKPSKEYDHDEQPDDAE